MVKMWAKGGRGGVVRRSRRAVLSALLVCRDLFDEVDDTAAQLGVVDPRKRFGQRQPVRGGKKIGDVSRRGRFSHSFRAPRARDVGRAIEEERDRYLQDVGDLLQAAGPYSVCALLVFLHLLKCQTQRVSELFLAHAQHHSAHAYPTANVLIDWIRRFFCYHTRPQETVVFISLITQSYGTPM